MAARLHPQRTAICEHIVGALLKRFDQRFYGADLFAIQQREDISYWKWRPYCFGALLEQSPPGASSGNTQCNPRFKVSTTCLQVHADEQLARTRSRYSSCGVAHPVHQIASASG